MSAISQQRGQKGFTLVELVVALVVLAVLTALAFPSMRSFIVRNRVRDAATDIFLVLNEARSEALKRNANITLRPVTAGAWASGWHVLDPVNAGQYLEEHQPLQVVTVTGPAAVTYQSTGRLSAAVGAFTVTASSAGSGSYTATATITIDPSGRPYITETL